MALAGHQQQQAATRKLQQQQQATTALSIAMPLWFFDRAASARYST
jgi:hypothetical protein